MNPVPQTRDRSSSRKLFSPSLRLRQDLFLKGGKAPRVLGSGEVKISVLDGVMFGNLYDGGFQ
jgi:hypothetical protein